ncbi:MAG: DUF3667 domain-containing protein, partial [Gemmatimonadetes bacterium]|nr:DUF3667 domain-containing protein [Gemmatimonadota bacterium]
MTIQSDAVEKSARGRERVPERPCPNCGTFVDDRFCPHCGQKNVERLLSLRRIAGDTLDDQLALNAALPRTLGALLTRPGFLTREYKEGRIARYLAPFRLYLLASVVFFVAMSFVTNANRIWQEAEPRIREWEAKHPGKRPENINVGVDTLAAPRWTRPLARLIVRQQDKLNAMPARESMRIQIESFNRNAPRAAFLLVPAFAAVLKVLFLGRRKRLYVEHFVFALHVQSFAFVLAAAALVLSGVPGRSFVVAGILLLYLLLAMKTAYGDGWPATVVRYVAVVLCYG